MTALNTAVAEGRRVVARTEKTPKQVSLKRAEIAGDIQDISWFLLRFRRVDQLQCFAEGGRRFGNFNQAVGRRSEVVGQALDFLDPQHYPSALRCRSTSFSSRFSHALARAIAGPRIEPGSLSMSP